MSRDVLWLRGERGVVSWLWLVWRCEIHQLVSTSSHSSHSVSLSPSSCPPRPASQPATTATDHHITSHHFTLLHSLTIVNTENMITSVYLISIQTQGCTHYFKGLSQFLCWKLYLVLSRSLENLFRNTLAFLSQFVDKNISKIMKYESFKQKQIFFLNDNNL